MFAKKKGEGRTNLRSKQRIRVRGSIGICSTAAGRSQKAEGKPLARFWAAADDPREKQVDLEERKKNQARQAPPGKESGRIEAADPAGRREVHIKDP